VDRAHKAAIGNQLRIMCPELANNRMFTTPRVNVSSEKPDLDVKALPGFSNTPLVSFHYGEIFIQLTDHRVLLHG